jgi:hypothetical protein
MQTEVVKTVFNTYLIHGLPAMYGDVFYEMMLAFCFCIIAIYLQHNLVVWI